MNILHTLLIIASITTIGSCAQDPTIKKYLDNQGDGLYGAIKVNDRIVFFALYYQQAPLTVSNFVGLATGKFEDHIERKGNYFDGIVFHRVVEDFVVQGGDPTGTGTGGPGYLIQDEFHPDLIHNDKGILSMANSGPNTNGSQFFITLSPTPHLDNKHSVFGKVVEGLDNLDIIIQDDEIQSMTIHAKGEEAEAFLNDLTWDSFNEQKKSIEASHNKKIIAAREEIIVTLEQEQLTKTEEGIYYTLLQEGDGAVVQSGDSVEVHYELSLYRDSQLLDSSYQRNQSFTVQVGNNEVIRGWEIILQKLRKGDKARVILPPELGYGDRGAGNGVIPPGAFLEFTIEVLNIE